MLVILYFCIMLLFFLKIRKENTIRRWIWGLYCFSALCSVLYPLVLPVAYEQNWLAYVYFTFCVLILLYPIWYFGKVNCNDFDFPERFVSWVSYMLIVFGVISLIEIFPQLFTLRTYLNNISEVRSAYYHGEELTVSSTSVIHVFANWIMYVQFFAPTFAFLNYIKGRKLKAFLLCVVSLVPALHGLLIGEREACVVVLSNFVFAYIIFRPVLSDEFAAKIKKIGFWFTFPLTIFVIAMTFSRFGEADVGVIGGLLVYIGEQPFNFSYFFSHINIDQQYLGGRMSFSYLFPETQLLDGQINEYIIAGEYLNVFGGIPGSMLLDFSYNAIFVIILIAVLFLIVFKSKRNIKTGKYDFSVFMTFLIYYQIIFMGIFYFDFKSKYDIYMCLVLYLTYFVMKYVLNFNKLISLNKA